MKEWDDADDADGIRPEAISVQLMRAEGEGEPEAFGDPVSLRAEDSWSYTWTDLDMYFFDEEDSQVDYTYTVKETDTEDLTGLGYEVGDPEEDSTANVPSYKITNRYEQKTVDLKVTKTWVDENNRDGDRPEFITLTLIGNDSILDTVNVTGEEDADTWEYTFEDLPLNENGEAIEYDVIEDPVADYTTQRKVEETKDDAGNVTSYDWTIINTHEIGMTTVTVKKVWDDDDNRDAKRPVALKVTLNADGEPAKDADDEPITAELTAANGWSAYWDVPV